jgi:hypothetical protein
MPGQTGDFPRLVVDPNARVAVALAYPQGKSGEPVALEVEEGGLLDNQGAGKVTALDDTRSLRFDYTVNEQLGIYRVAVRKGADVKVLNFWVGPEPELKR